jgi:hypothetical protein
MLFIIVLSVFHAEKALTRKTELNTGQEANLK